MTNSDKKARRELRHKMQAVVKAKHFGVDYKAKATNSQLSAASRKIVDVLLSGKNPQIVANC